MRSHFFRIFRKNVFFSTFFPKKSQNSIIFRGPEKKLKNGKIEPSFCGFLEILKKPEKNDIQKTRFFQKNMGKSRLILRPKFEAGDLDLEHSVLKTCILPHFFAICRNFGQKLRVRGLGKPFFAIPADLPIYEEMPNPFQIPRPRSWTPFFRINIDGSPLFLATKTM